MQHIAFRTDFDGMAGIVSALEADDHIHISGQHIDKFTFTFISPLGPNQNINRHNTPSYIKNY